MQAHPMYEENRRLRAENERLRGVIRESTRRNLRRYARVQMRREEKKAFFRRMQIRMGLMLRGVLRALDAADGLIAQAKWMAQEIWRRMPMSAKCILCSWIGGEAVIAAVVAVFAWRI